MMNASPREGCPESVKCNWQWAQQHEPAALTFVRDHVWRTCCRESTIKEDTSHATDYVIKAPGDLSVGMRIRRISNTKMRRHFTLRKQVRSGATTELEKVENGYMDIYCYCWVNDIIGGILDEYIIVDMHEFRRSGLLAHPDGTRWTNDKSAQFAWWELRTLVNAGCVLEGVKYPDSPVAYRLVL